MRIPTFVTLLLLLAVPAPSAVRNGMASWRPLSVPGSALPITDDTVNHLAQADSSECEGSQDPHTYVLGIDWFDTSGTEPPGGGNSAQVPISLRAQQGVLYLGGNRFTAPMTLSVSGRQLAVNGMTLPPEPAPTFPKHVPTTNDTLRDLLDKAAVAKARDGVSRGLPMVDVMRSVRDVYTASPIVRSATSDSTGLWVAYIDRTGTPNRKMFSRDDLLHIRTPQEVAQNAAEHAYEWLRGFKAHLDGGGLLVCLRHTNIFIPYQSTRFVDAMLQKMVAGQPLSASEADQLRSVLAVERWQEASTLIPLVRTN